MVRIPPNTDTQLPTGTRATLRFQRQERLPSEKTPQELREDPADRAYTWVKWRLLGPPRNMGSLLYLICNDGKFYHAKHQKLHQETGEETGLSIPVLLLKAKVLVQEGGATS